MMQQLATVTSNGAAVTYDNGVFAVGGETVGVEKVIEYDKLGILMWANDETRAWVYQTAAPTTPPLQPTAVAQPVGIEAKPKKPIYKRWWVWAIAALLLIAVIGSQVDGDQEQAANTSPSSSNAAPKTQEPAPTEPAPTEPAPTPEEPAAAPAPAPKPVKKTYVAISSRNFAKLAKDPDSYIGKTYVIYGEVTQFDAATGTDTFRANTGPKKLSVNDFGMTDYDENSLVTGTEKLFSDVVDGDVFVAYMTVLGSYSYDTQIGGSTTVPWFQADYIRVYDSTAD